MNTQKESIIEITTHKGLQLNVGHDYVVDKKSRGGHKVKLVKIYGKYFCRVQDSETNAEWDTMLNRLSEIN